MKTKTNDQTQDTSAKTLELQQLDRQLEEKKKEYNRLVQENVKLLHQQEEIKEIKQQQRMEEEQLNYLQLSTSSLKECEHWKTQWKQINEELERTNVENKQFYEQGE